MISCWREEMMEESMLSMICLYTLGVSALERKEARRCLM